MIGGSIITTKDNIKGNFPSLNLKPRGVFKRDLRQLGTAAVHCAARLAVDAKVSGMSHSEASCRV